MGFDSFGSENIANEFDHISVAEQSDAQWQIVHTQRVQGQAFGVQYKLFLRKRPDGEVVHQSNALDRPVARSVRAARSPAIPALTMIKSGSDGCVFANLGAMAMVVKPIRTLRLSTLLILRKC